MALKRIYQNVTSLQKLGLESTHIFKLCCLDSKKGTARYSSSISSLSKDTFNLNKHASPQGIQGNIDEVKECEINKQWLANCRKYGLGKCNEQLQGIQGDEKSLSEVLSEQDSLIREIAVKYEEMSEHQRVRAIQGVQGDFSAFPLMNTPCPQGVQGDDCMQYKMWLENCYRYGISDCIDQFEHFTAGRKTLQQIFAEQEKEIKDAAVTFRIKRMQRRNFSTSTSVHSKKEPGLGKKEQESSDDSPQIDEVQLTPSQKLKQAVKDYGATVMVFHISMALASLGLFYTLVSCGLDVPKFLRLIGVEESIIQGKLAGGATTFVMAYAIHKAFAVVRIGITLTCTPLIVRHLRRIGVLKTPGKPK